MRSWVLPFLRFTPAGIRGRRPRVVAYRPRAMNPRGAEEGDEGRFRPASLIGFT